jgi:hypothetical protein
MRDRRIAAVFGVEVLAYWLLGSGNLSVGLDSTGLREGNSPSPWKLVDNWVWLGWCFALMGGTRSKLGRFYFCVSSSFVFGLGSTRSFP